MQASTLGKPLETPLSRLPCAHCHSAHSSTVSPDRGAAVVILPALLHPVRLAREQLPQGSSSSWPNHCQAVVVGQNDLRKHQTVKTACKCYGLRCSFLFENGYVLHAAVSVLQFKLMATADSLTRLTRLTLPAEGQWHTFAAFAKAIAR